MKRRVFNITIHRHYNLQHIKLLMIRTTYQISCTKHCHHDPIVLTVIIVLYIFSTAKWHSFLFQIYPMCSRE